MADGDDGVQLLDENGDIFGVVNVVDVLVVLVVLAAAVAGVALVFGGGEDPPATATTNVTVDLGTQPAFIVSAIQEGDTYSPTQTAQLRITDVHLTPQGGQVRVILRAELTGERSGGSISYDGAPPRLGRSLEIVTSEYQVGGQIRAVGAGDTLSRTERTVVLRDRLPADAATDLAPGDEIRVAGRTVVTIENVTVYPTNSPAERIVYVAATVTGIERDGQVRFGGTPIRAGQTLTLDTERYTFEGRIDRVGGGLDRGQTDVLVSDTVDSETADRLAEGDVVLVDGQRTATVERVTVYGTNDPDRKRVFVGLSLETVGYGQLPRFGATTIQDGNGLSLRTDAYALDGTIERVGTTDQRGTETTTTVTLRMSEVREEFANALRPGMTERAGDEVIAEVTDVAIDPTTILVRGENGSLGVFDHPTLREVTITADLRVRETTDGVRFKGETIRQGQTIILDLGTITVQVTVVSVGS